MIIPVLKFCHRSTLVALEIIVAIALVILGMMCFLFWKFSQGPVDITFAADTVKSALISPDHNTDFKFESIVAEWPEFSGPISIGLSGVQLLENKKPVINIPQLGIRIAKAPLFIGKIHPEAVIVKDATIKLVRSTNGGVHLFLNNEVNEQKKIVIPTVEEDSTNTSFRELGEALFQGGNLPDYHQIQPLSQLERVSVENAHVIIIDEAAMSGWDIPQLNFEVLRDEYQFTLTANYQDDSENLSNISFQFDKSPKDQSLSFHSEMDKINVSTLGQLFLPIIPEQGPQFIVQGKINGQLDKNWNVLKLEGDLFSEQGDLNLDGLYQTPLKFSDLNAHLTYDATTKKIALSNTHININNRTISMSGEKSAGDESGSFALNLEIPELTFDELQALWPNGQKDSVAADWLTKRLSKAKVTNFKLMLPIQWGDELSVDTQKLEASLTYENLTADYRSPLIPATEAKGKATLKGDVLSISVDSGKLGDMDIRKAQIDIPYLTHPSTVGTVLINTNVTGNLSSALKYIALDPINLGEKVGINPEKVKGGADINVQVSFPALKDLPKEEVKVVVDAKLDNILLPAIVKGMDLTGGPYTLSVKDAGVTLSGNGMLGGQNIDLTYSEYINPSEAPYMSSIQASLIANKKMRDAFAVHLDPFLEGDVPVKIDYLQDRKGDETVKVDVDVAPAVVKFNPFRFRKEKGHAGKVTCTALIQNKQIRQIQDLNIAIDKMGGAKGKIQFGTVGNIYDVKSGHFSSVTLGGANNVALDFTQSLPNVFDVNVSGKQLDIRPYLSHSNVTAPSTDKPAMGQTDGAEINLTTRVEKLKTGSEPDQVLTSPELALRTNKKGEVTSLSLKGTFVGGTLSTSLKPDARGITKLQISSNNAGGALRALDIYNHMIGGQLDIRGTQIAGAGINDIRGRAIIKNFTVVKAPILAKLINLFSLSGLTELLQNKGIEFGSLKTNFEWKDTKAGRIIALSGGRTTGASIGLTFGGNVYQDKATIDLSGTFVPMSEINGFFNKIPLIGGLLTGGKNGGIIAATYAMTGKTENPSVFLNPLSVLTPGFLRSILFEGKDSFEDIVDDEETTNDKKKAGYNK